MNLISFLLLCVAKAHASGHLRGGLENHVEQRLPDVAESDNERELQGEFYSSGESYSSVTANDDKVYGFENKSLLIKTKDIFSNDKSTALSDEELNTLMYQTLTSNSFQGNIYQLEASLKPELHLFDISQPKYGVAERTTGGNIMYTAPDYWYGLDSFTYTATDGKGNFDTATIDVYIDSVENDPVAKSDEFEIGVDETLIISSETLLANDLDPDENGIDRVYISRDIKFGTLEELEPNMMWKYTPSDGFTGRDTFRYTVVDSMYKEDSALVEIFVG